MHSLDPDLYLEALRRRLVPEDHVAVVVSTDRNGDTWWHLGPDGDDQGSSAGLRAVPAGDLVKEFDDEDLDGAYTGTAFVCRDCPAVQASTADLTDAQQAALRWLRSTRLLRHHAAATLTRSPTRHDVLQTLGGAGLLLAATGIAAAAHGDFTVHVNDEVEALRSLYTSTRRVWRPLRDDVDLWDPRRWDWVEVHHPQRLDSSNVALRSAAARQFAELDIDDLAEAAFVQPTEGRNTLIVRVDEYDLVEVTASARVGRLEGADGTWDSAQVRAALRILGTERLGLAELLPAVAASNL